MIVRRTRSNQTDPSQQQNRKVCEERTKNKETLTERTSTMTIQSIQKHQQWLNRAASKKQIPISITNMDTKTKLVGIITMLSFVFLTFPASEANTETTQAPNGPTLTKIRVNGLSADTFLFDGETETHGFLNVSRDEIANTTSIDFTYATPDPDDPEIVILIQAAGEIPNGAFTISSTEAHLAVTTTFPINRCVVNFVTAVFDCDPGTPITFDLTWARNGIGSVLQRAQRTETFGPVTTRFKGDYQSWTATVNGTWTGHTALDMLGNLVDTKHSINVREITVEANP